MDSLRVEYLLGRIKHHFKLINKCQDFTEADKAQLKTFYLEHFVAPDARKIMEKSFSEAFGKAANSKPAQRPHTHQDRSDFKPRTGSRAILAWPIFFLLETK